MNFVRMISKEGYLQSQKNDTDVAHYNFKAHQLILVFLAEMLLRDWVMLSNGDLLSHLSWLTFLHYLAKH